MTSMHTSRRRRHATALASAAALALLVTGCEGPFAHSNPLDPENTTRLTLVGGTDTITHTQQRFALELIGDPPLPERIRIVWSSNASRLRSLSGGSYWATPSLVPVHAQAIATVGDNVAIREFVILQHVGELVMDCQAMSVCDTLRSLDVSQEFDVSGRDTHHFELQELPQRWSSLSVVVRDPAVVELTKHETIPRFRVDSRANGTTWAVTTLDGVSDSIRLVVRQRIVSWDSSCPATVPVGQTVALAGDSYRDANDRLVAGIEPPPLTWAAGEPHDPGASATVTPDGQFTAHATGIWITSSTSPGIEWQSECTIRIVPAP